MALPPWLVRQLQALQRQRGHALLLAGPPGLGQYDLALELARTWLCEQPGAYGSCGHCRSCHAIAVRTHADLFVLMPEVQAMALGWPLDPRTQDKIDKKEIKPSKFIRVEPAREAIAFTQMTASRGGVRVVLVSAAERLNVESANALLKTLEEPPGSVRFILATEAAHALLPTIRSRCLTHTLEWPSDQEAMAWLSAQNPGMPESDLAVACRATGGRPEQAQEWLQSGWTATAWAALPTRIAQGDWQPLSDWSVPRQMDALLKLCHDLMVCRAGGSPRFFDASHLPTPGPMPQLNAWHRDLLAASRTMEHPYNAGLLQEAWSVRARQALALHSPP
jgi:DNA polymerase-3 subunit delta'